LPRTCSRLSISSDPRPAAQDNARSIASRVMPKRRPASGSFIPGTLPSASDQKSPCESRAQPTGSTRRASRASSQCAARDSIIEFEAMRTHQPARRRFADRTDRRLLRPTAAVVGKAESAAEHRLAPDGLRRGGLHPMECAGAVICYGPRVDDDAGGRLTPVTPGRFRLPRRPDLGARSVRRRPDRARAPCPGPAPC